MSCDSVVLHARSRPQRQRPSFIRKPSLPLNPFISISQASLVCWLSSHNQRELHKLLKLQAMSTNGGLSRRRVPGGSSSTTTDDDPSSAGTGASSPRTTSPRNSTLSPTTSGGAKHAGSAFEGGSKIAYDPRDLEREGEEMRRGGGKAPKLTIMEEVLLLGLKDKQVRIYLAHILHVLAVGMQM